jgi:hypothetical protein
LKKIGAIFGFIKKSKGFPTVLVFFVISWKKNYRKSHGVYGSLDRGWLSVHSGLATMGQRDLSGAQEVIVITRREREEEEVVGVLTNGTT